MQSTTLYFKESSSDKVYQASLEQAPGGFVVNFAYGRRGATLTTGTKTTSPVDAVKAQKIYDKLVAGKKAKGYKEGADGTAFTTAGSNDTGVRCQLLNFVDEAEVTRLIASPDWWAQPKKDGKRLLVKKAGADLTAINRKGLSVGAPQPILDSVAAVAGDCLIDGEAVGETLFAFDLIDAPDLPYSARLARLEAMALSDAVTVVETARTPAEKQAMVDRLLAEGAEGVVFKRHAAPYTAGRPNSGGTQVKFKFYAAVSALVTNVNAQRSVALAMLDGDKQVAVGNVTIPANHEIPAVGAVVEVRYLYAYKGGSLYQPTYLGERDDVEADDISALKYKAEE